MLLLGGCTQPAPPQATVTVTPTVDPFNEDWVAVAVSPEAVMGGYGVASSAEEASQIATDECALRSAGTRCVVASGAHLGCAAYAVDPATRQWAGGEGATVEAAVADALGKLPPNRHPATKAGGQCANP